MRTKHSFRNVLVGVISQLLIVIIGFISRKIFIVTLGNEMLGVNGLFTSIISMLALTELGIGTAIVCNLFRPLADKNETKIISLVQFYAKAYRVIGFIVLGLGLAVTPFLGLLIKEKIDTLFLSIIFLLFLADTVVSYFFAHKRSLIFADQRNYIVMIVTTVSTIAASLLQIGILLLTRNYILYLTIKILIRVIENFVIAAIADKRYPFIKRAKKIPLDGETKTGIISNTKALSLHYIGNYLVNGTDNIIISGFLGVVIVGFYSNYFMIISTLRQFLNQFSTGILASFGNVLASESKEKAYDVFKKAYFINYAIYSFASISLLCLFNPFITLWINADSLLDSSVVAIISLNFFVTGVTEVLGSVRTSAGLFRPDRYLHILLAAVNLIVSILLVQIIGIFGVFLGTFLCLMIKEVSVLPSIVYRNVFKVRVREYYKMLIAYAMTTFFAAAVTMFFCMYLIQGGGILWFLLRCIVCVIIPNVIVILVFRKRPEYAYLKEFTTSKLGALKSMVHKK